MPSHGGPWHVTVRAFGPLVAQLQPLSVMLSVSARTVLLYYPVLSATCQAPSCISLSHQIPTCLFNLKG